MVNNCLTFTHLYYMRNKSKRIYAESLLMLLEKFPYDCITISEICDHTSLTRRTFYNNFSSKDDVAIFICEELMEGYISLIHKDGEFNISKMSALFYEFAISEKERFLILYNSGVFHLFSKVFTQRLNYINSIIPNNLLNDISITHQYYTFLFHSAGVLRIFEHWLSSGMNETPQELSSIYTSIVQDVQSHVK